MPNATNTGSTRSSGMTSFFAPPPTAPHGSYVVARPERTDAIGDILRASFVPDTAAIDDMRYLLARLDRPTD